MQKVLRRQYLWWVCLAAAARVSMTTTVTLEAKKTVAEAVTGVEDTVHCRVLDLNLDPIQYSLPSNLTIKPLQRWWFLKFILTSNNTWPIACIYLEHSGPFVDVSLFSGDCHNGIKVHSDNLNRTFEFQTWTTLYLKVTNDTVLVQEPRSESAKLRSKGLSLRQDGLQMTVTEAWRVESAVGCAVSCPVYYHPSSEENPVKKRIKNWKQDRLHFYFRPGANFTKLHYEVKCKYPVNTVVKEEVEITPGEESEAKKWHLVQIVQRDNNVTVIINDKLQESIQLPESCTSSMHVIWTVGDGYFGFNCTPKDAITARGKEVSTNGTQPGTPLPPGVLAVISAATFLVVLVVLLEEE